LRIRTRGARVDAGVKAAAEAAPRIVEHLAHLNAAREEFPASRGDVLHRQEEAVDRSRLSEVIPLPKMIDAAEPGGVNCMARNSPLAAWSISRRKPSCS
jgi:hypothetical protein